MTLSVIGAGFGHAGTKSLKLALGKLGFGRCRYMSELHENLELAASRGIRGNGLGCLVRLLSVLCRLNRRLLLA